MKRLPPLFILILVTLIISLVYWSGLAATPFHPDESTQIYMSADMEIFLHRPSDAFWQPQPPDGLRQHYRLVDAPLTRTLIFLGRTFTGQPAIATDWDWGKTWEENLAAGAVPNASQLLVARWSIAWLFPLTLLLAYKIGEKIHSKRMGWITFSLLAANSLVLLHTRRAMAESGLLFSVVFSLWALLTWKKHPWLIAIPLALAFNAKQSAAPLVLVGLLAIFLSTANPQSLRRKFFQTGAFLALFCGLVFLANPFLWQHPIQAAIQSWNERQAVINNQLAMLRSIGSNQVLDTLPMRGLGLLSSLYLSPLSFFEVGNYMEFTATAESAYLANPLHSLLRDSSGAALLFALSVVGFLLMIRDSRLRSAFERTSLTLLVWAGVIEFAGLMYFVPMAWQRYAIPLVPFACLFSAYCIERLLEKAQRARANKNPSQT